MSRYRTVVRVVFAVAFLSGALVHLYFGLFSPHSYAPFADTVLWPWLAELWRGFVMASIGWLSLLTAVFELAVGLGLLARGYARRAAVLAALGFFAFTGAVWLIGTRVFKSSATFDQVAYAFALFFVPLSVVSSLLGLIPFLGILAALPVVVVEVYLGIHATRGSLNLTERREVYLTLLGGVLGNILVGGMVTAIVGAMVFASLMRGY